MNPEHWNPGRALPFRLAGTGLLMVCLLGIIACGGDPPPIEPADLLPAGSLSSDELNARLKFDSRIEGFSMDGDNLIVDVTEDWVISPTGLKEHSLGQWYNWWQAAKTPEGGQRSSSLEVTVRHEGDVVARWTPRRGFEPVSTTRTAS